jgi:hypothetical protein
MRTIALRLLAFAVMLAPTACIQPPNVILKSFDTTTGEPVPMGLQDPGSWVYLGQQSLPGPVQSMRWIRPEGTPPRPVAVPAKDGSAPRPDPAAQLGKPATAPTGTWSASYEFQTAPSPGQPGQAYFAAFRRAMMAECPSAEVTPLQLDSVEIVVEAHARGCPRFGQQSQIDRFLFGGTDLYHMVYAIHAGSFAPGQRREALDAVTAWNFTR